MYEPPTLLLMQQIFATAKCRKVLITQYGAQWRECSLSGQSIPSGEEAGDAFARGFQMKINATVDVTRLATNVKKAYGGSLQRTEASEGRRGLVDLATVEQKGNFPESGGNFDDGALTDDDDDDDDDDDVDDDDDDDDDALLVTMMTKRITAMMMRTLMVYLDQFR